jgi:hypothetical protein
MKNASREARRQGLSTREGRACCAQFGTTKTTAVRAGIVNVPVDES